MHKVLFTGSTFSEQKINELKKKGLDIIPASANLSKEELVGKLHDCDAVIVNGNEYYDESILKECKNLKIISFFGIGFQKSIDIEAAKKHNIIVCNTPKVNSYSVAEFCLGLIFTLNQKIIEFNNETKNGIWKEKQFFDLKNKTIGIIGLGHIGTYLANILYKGFDAKILYYDIVPKYEEENKYNATRVSLEELFSKSDIVSIQLPLNQNTTNLIGKDLLSLMKPSAYLINTARAEIIDYEALYKILNTNKIAGCAFDGFYQEPIDLNAKEAKLLSLNNFILTPHTGYFAYEGTERVENMCINNLIQIFDNKPCNSIITK
ncbi:MAG: hypothetical protein HFI86_03340 [Bacilli bacterium]|nr:hypothetical protein [Bacilli bacterium]